MNDERDPYWDDLGMAWHAVSQDTKPIAARLNARLRAQAFLTQGLMVVGFPLCVALLALATYTLYVAVKGQVWNFVIRGSALAVLAALLASAAWAQRTKELADRNSLSQMLDLAISRNRSLRRAAGIGVAMCVVAAMFGIGGYFVRASLGRPAAMSPLEPLAFLVLMASALLTYLHFTGGEADRLRYLKGVLTPESVISEM